MTKNNYSMDWEKVQDNFSHNITPLKPPARRVVNVSDVSGWALKSLTNAQSLSGEKKRNRQEPN
jgi:hypothetical protein